MIATSHLEDDFSCSTFNTETSSESSPLDFKAASWFDDFFKRANERLDEEMNEIRKKSDFSHLHSLRFPSTRKVFSSHLNLNDSSFQPSFDPPPSLDFKPY